MKLKTSQLALIIIGGFIGLILILLISGFFMAMSYKNKFVGADETVKQQWANVENVYQRRADLIPNLVATVKGVANFEKQTLTDVIEARAKATQVKVDPSKLDPASIQKFQAAQDGLSGALGRLMVVVEKYPELKATQNFSELQAQLEGTENRITVERRNFNEVVQKYNIMIKRFPASIFAGWFNFLEKGYFQAQQGAEKAPAVKFD